MQKEGIRKTTIMNNEVIDVSESVIGQFCASCDRLGDNNLCNGISDAFQNQAERAWYGNCWRASVKGLRGDMRDRLGYRRGIHLPDSRTPEFFPNDWMGKTEEEIYANLTDKAKKLVAEVPESEIVPIRAYIEAKIQERTEHYQDQWNKREQYAVNLTEYPSYPYRSVFNNFFCHLPFPDSYFDNTGINLRALSKEYHWDIALQDYYAGKDRGEVKNHSVLRLSQTGKEFYATIDAAILHEGLSIEEIVRMNDPSYHDDNRYVRLFKYTMPAFARLKALYTWRELT